MIQKLYKLRFKTPVHISTGGFGLEDVESGIHSDTLYSAVCLMVKEWYGESILYDKFLNEANPIRLSSAFPYWRDTYFLPKPILVLPSNFDRVDYANQKSVKKIKYVDMSVYADILTSKWVYDDATQVISNGCWRSLTSDERIEKSKKKLNFNVPNLYQIHEIPRVTLDRVTNSPQIFYLAVVDYHKEAGLYFLANLPNEATATVFSAALRALGDVGIGGERSIGKGVFEVIEEKDAANFLPEIQDANAHLLLSLYTPKQQEASTINFHKSDFQLINRKGWVTGKTLRRKTLRTLSEGSILSMPNAPLGSLEIVLPKMPTGNFLNYDVYRNFTAFSLPIKL